MNCLVKYWVASCFLVLILALSTLYSLDESQRITSNPPYKLALAELEAAKGFAQKIKNEEIRCAVIFEVEDCEKCFSKNSNILLEKALQLNENINEIIAECGSDSLREDISAHLYRFLKQAEHVVSKK